MPILSPEFNSALFYPSDLALGEVSVNISLSHSLCLSLAVYLSLLCFFLPSLYSLKKGDLKMELNERRLDVLAIIASDIKLMSKIIYLWVVAIFSSTYQFLGFNFCIESRVYALVFCLLGRVRSLSTSLWSLTHLTALHLNDNNLARIPPDIAKLHNLVYLDLSSNKLRSLPAELGNMVSLRWGNIKDMIRYIKLQFTK